MPTPRIRPIDVLFCCTGNQCRSPMAEALTRDRLQRSEIGATVGSRGLLEGGQPVPDPARAALRRRGIDVDGFTSTRIDAEAVRGARLILGMERRHVREAVVLDRAALGRAFTIREFVERATVAGPRRGAPWDGWLGELSGDRSPSALLGDTGPGDMPDPMGHPPEVFEAVAAEIEDLVERVVWLAFGGPEPADPPVAPVSIGRPPLLAGAAGRTRSWLPRVLRGRGAASEEGPA